MMKCGPARRRWPGVSLMDDFAHFTTAPYLANAAPVLITAVLAFSLGFFLGAVLSRANHLKG